MKEKKNGPGDEWETPPVLFDKMNAICRNLTGSSFRHDVCASEQNHKVVDYWTKEDDAMRRTPEAWARLGPLWMNPPYSDPSPWMAMAMATQHAGGTLFALVPAALETRYFRKHVYGVADSILVLSRRVRFVGATASAKGPNVVVIYRPHLGETRWIPFDISTP